tara:strand:- start:537 stop:824 length:288 start_codon:yes stop_codon:yes gene_type:complete
LILAYSIILIVLCVVIVGYPLFFERLRFFHLPEMTPEYDQEHLFDEQESLLTTLSELEDEYLLGKVSKEDYKQQKLLLNRKYLQQKTLTEKNQLD